MRSAMRAADFWRAVTVDETNLLDESLLELQCLQDAGSKAIATSPRSRVCISGRPSW